MEEITVHKVRYTLDEFAEALHIKGIITHVYASSYGTPKYIEITLEDENK